MLLSAYRRAAQNGGRAEEPAPPSNGPEGPDQAPNGPSGPSPQPGGKGPLLRVIEGGKTESGRIDGAAGRRFAELPVGSAMRRERGVERGVGARARRWE